MEQLTGDGWLPPSVASSIALRAAAVQTLDAAPNTPVAFPMTGTGPESAAYGFQQERPAYSSQRDGAACDSRQSRGAYDFEHEAPCPTQTPSASGSGRPYDGSGHPGRQGEVPPPGGADGEPPGSQRHSRTEPYSAPEEPEPYRPSSAGHRRTVPRPGPSRRTVLTVSAGSATAAVAGAALVLGRPEKAAERSTEPAGPAPKPLWTYRGGPLLQAPAVFNNGTALVKTRPGDLVCLDLKDGTRPKWVYEGISQSPTPTVLAFDAAIALGEGATVIGVDPVDGGERFTIDFGPDFRFDTLLGATDDRAVTVIGVRLQRDPEEQGVATSTDTVFGVDLAGRRAEVIPISPEDVGVRLAPVILPDFFVYADGLRNVTARSTENSGVVWRHPVGYDLRPGLAVLNRTVFAIGRELEALNLSTGKLRWRVKPERGMFASLGGYGNTVYVTGTDPAGVYAFNAGTGARRWFCPTPRLNIDQPVTAGPDAVYVPAHQNKNGIYAIGAAKGRLLWNFTDGVETGVNDWQLACDHSGVLVAQHYDRTYGLPAP